ncbi:MAG TPA: ABC transporter permease [Patescibacteria group bacterium]|nr:ABC transporter permease [Patescibacteria group bacterium]
MQELFEIITESIGTLTLNKLRTGLAVLGIVIGIGSVIALVSLGQASQQAVQSQIQSLGSNLLTINPGSQRTGAVQGGAGSTTTLTYEDAQAIASSAQITTVGAVAPQLSRRAQVTAGSSNTNTSVIGTTDGYLPVNSISMQEGRFLSATDIVGISKVAVLGPQVATALFPNGTDPVGQTIRINKQAFLVIGITVSKGGSGFANRDDTIFIPLTTAQKEIFGVDYVSSISLSAKSPEVMVDAENQVGYLLLARHKLSSPAQADFTILSQSDILSAVDQTTGTFTTLLSGIAAISLLVGGIGIMNIMLVTVNERTREIGLRKALGAKKKIIITQFLVEAILLTFIGGLIGIILGVLFSYGYSLLTGSLFVISPISVVLAFLVSAGIGILFGWYPAKRAANLQPIEALRYE